MLHHAAAAAHMARYTAARYPDWQDKVVREVQAAGLTGGRMRGTPSHTSSAIAPLQQYVTWCCACGPEQS
jgi:hypothetical protein